jgi:Protein of unknown function (DUF3131)
VLSQNNVFMMKQMWLNYKKVRHLLGVRFVSLYSSLESGNKEGTFTHNHWRLNNRIKGLIALAIIAVMLVSAFAWLSMGVQSKPSTFQPESNNPTAEPFPTSQQTTNPTPSPTETKSPTEQSGFMNLFNSAAAALMDVISPPKPLGIIESSQTANSTMWSAVAVNAWRYFEPGVGVETTTGLPGSSADYSAFTDWDLGSYIQAVIDAQKIGLISPDGTWGSSRRLETVVRFLETRELNSTTNYPYWFYQSKDGKNYHINSDKATDDVDVTDTGRLLVALNNLRLFNSSLATRINNIVLYGQLYNRSNYAALVPSIKAESLSSNSIYFYFVASGFESFWPNELADVGTTILNNIFSTGNVTTYGVSLPKAAITCDPLLYSFFELNKTDSRVQTLLNQVYFAHEAYYNSTGKYRAFSEGPSLSGEWVWEWVVLPDGRTWVPLKTMYQNTDMSPMIYNKVALSFLSIYNTTFAKNMSVYLEKNLPNSDHGFYDGVDESGTALDNGVYCNTNGLILAAALRVIRGY